MDPSRIQAGKIYEEYDGPSRYVVELVPAGGRGATRVRWRRPGAFAENVMTQTLSTFAAAVRRELADEKADRAPALPNGGLSA
jgi:hypothetical protein